ncbi:UNVERIFIED_CONTAM: hypothetical protein FKN15_000571 [Acipenser sinensis]
MSFEQGVESSDGNDSSQVESSDGSDSRQVKSSDGSDSSQVESSDGSDLSRNSVSAGEAVEQGLAELVKEWKRGKLSNILPIMEFIMWALIKEESDKLYRALCIPLLHNAIPPPPLIERWLRTHPMTLYQGRADNAPGAVLSELLLECSVPPAQAVPLESQRATSADWQQDNALSIAASEEVGEQELPFLSEESDSKPPAVKLFLSAELMPLIKRATAVLQVLWSTEGDELATTPMTPQCTWITPVFCIMI